MQTSKTKELPLAIQVYSVRSLMQTQFEETLRALAGIGFKNLEWSGTFGDMPPEKLAALLGQLDLNVMGMHANPNDLLNPTSMIYQYARTLRPEFLTCSSGINATTFTDTVRQIREANRVAADQGFVLTYHNHAHEFDKLPDGRLILDAMLEETDAHGQQFLFDVFFAFFRGLEPCQYLRRFAGRIPTIHFNDLDASARASATPARGGMDLSTELGAGCMDLPAIHRTALDTGVRWLVLEQHRLRENPLDSARRNFEYASKLGHKEQE